MRKGYRDVGVWEHGLSILTGSGDKLQPRNWLHISHTVPKTRQEHTQQCKPLRLYWEPGFSWELGKFDESYSW